MKDLVSLPVRSGEGVLVVEAAHGDAPKDVLALPDRLRAELEEFFLWSTRWERKDLRFLGWSGIDEAETLLSAAERSFPCPANCPPPPPAR